MLRTVKNRKKKVYRINTSSPFAKPLFQLFCSERLMQISPKVKNIIELFISELDRNRLDTVILFGSHVWGLGTERSDIDVCVVCSDKNTIAMVKNTAKKLFPEGRFEVHIYSPEDFKDVSDFVVLDSLLNGIPLIGSEYFFDTKGSIRHVDKKYLIHRLKMCEDYFKRSQKVRGPARDYFIDLIYVSLGEIRSILEHKVTIPKKKIIERPNISVEIERLHREISRLGDKIWLE
ncbi:MAG: nucleotidyltransferase domain-containing protein [Candidatus Thermoplasmatota archaeon]